VPRLAVAQQDSESHGLIQSTAGTPVNSRGSRFDFPGAEGHKVLYRSRSLKKWKFMNIPSADTSDLRALQSCGTTAHRMAANLERYDRRTEQHINNRRIQMTNSKTSMNPWKSRGVRLAGMALLVSLAAGPLAAQEEPAPGKPYDPLPKDKVLVTKVNHFSVMCWKVATAGGTMYFEAGKEAGGRSGISSLFDKDGNDWVGADFSGRGTKDFPYNKVPDCYNHATRGFPKFTCLYGEFETPSKKTGAETKWLDKDGKEITFTDKLEGEHLIMRSFIEGKMGFEYHFFPTHVAIKHFLGKDNYAFHFQGLIGGEPEKSPKDYVVLKDGVHRDLAKGIGMPSGITNKVWPSPFVYMVDSDEKKTQVLFLAAKNLPENHDDEGWLATCPDGSPIIAVLSFGRKPGSYSGYTISGDEPIFVFGFQPKAAGHEAISSFIEARLADPLKPAKSK
jgi:hypothetical protein